MAATGCLKQRALGQGCSQAAWDWPGPQAISALWQTEWTVKQGRAQMGGKACRARSERGQQPVRCQSPAGAVPGLGAGAAAWGTAASHPAAALPHACAAARAPADQGQILLWGCSPSQRPGCWRRLGLCLKVPSLQADARAGIEPGQLRGGPATVRTVIRRMCWQAAAG